MRRPYVSLFSPGRNGIKMDFEERDERAKRLISLAREFRQNAADTQITFYVELMTRTAGELEALSASEKDGAHVADDMKLAATHFSTMGNPPTPDARPALRSAGRTPLRYRSE